MAESKFFDIGLTITIFLIATSSMFTFVSENSWRATEVSDLGNEKYAKSSIQGDIDSIQTKFEYASNNFTSDPLKSGGSFVEGVIDMFMLVAGLVFGMLTGWVTLLELICRNFGVKAVAGIITPVFAAIEFFTIYFILKDPILALLGRFG